MVRDTTLGPWRWMGIVVVAPCFPPVLVESVTVCNDTCNDASPAQRPWSQSLFNHHDTRRVNGWRATDCVVLLAGPVPSPCAILASRIVMLGALTSCAATATGYHLERKRLQSVQSLLDKCSQGHFGNGGEWHLQHASEWSIHHDTLPQHTAPQPVATRCG